ncbi:MAG: hypothetical protein M3500_03330 [Actinomycetota bacterium]|nr:hypothetical protein [Actinomycetota bacterium]
MGWLVVAVLLIVLLAVWITWTANRIDRLFTRVEAARASLDAQLVRRSASAQALADESTAALGKPLAARLRVAAHEALTAEVAGREAAENDLGRTLTQLEGIDLDRQRLAELREAATRVGIARRFYNDAVRDLSGLRAQRMPRLLRLGARRPVPAFFEIDDRLWSPAPSPAAANAGIGRIVGDVLHPVGSDEWEILHP